MFKTSDSTAKLDLALSKAQGEMKPAVKDKVNIYFNNSKYASLDSLLASCKEALAKHEISITQWLTHSEDNRVHCITRLAHHGEWMMCEFSVPASKQDAQQYGSASSYIRRYSLASALGQASEEDDDGNEASKQPLVVDGVLGNTVVNTAHVKPKPSPAPETPVKPRNTAKGLIELQKVIQNLSLDVNHVRRASKALFGKDNSAGLSPEELGELTSFLKGDMRDQESFIMELEKAVRL